MLGRVVVVKSTEEWLSIDFAPGGNAQQFIKEGWSFQESEGIWGIGLESSLRLPAAPEPGFHRLEMIASSLAGSPHVETQRLAVVVNGKKILSDCFKQRAPRPVQCIIPNALLRVDRENEIILHHPDAISPARFRSGRGDHRQLGICVLRLKIELLRDHSAVPTAPPQRGRIARSKRKLVLCRWTTVLYHVGCMLESFPAFDDTFEMRYIRGDADWGKAIDALPDGDRDRLAVLLEEVTETSQQITSQHNLDEVIHFRIPKLSMDCLWPLRGHDARLRPEPPFYPDGRYPLTDIAALQLAGEVATDDELFDRYLVLSQRLMPDLESGLARDVERWRARDACADVKVGDFILAQFRAVPLFHGPNVPAGKLLRHVVEQLLGALLSSFPMSPSELYQAFDEFVHGYQGPFFDQAPVHPLVVEGFGISFLSPNYLYRRGHTKRTFRKHILDYIRWTPWFTGRLGSIEAVSTETSEGGGAGLAAGVTRRSAASRKPVLLIYANCQGDHIAKMLSQNECLTDQIEIRYVFIHSLEEPGKGWNTYPDNYMNGVTWVWEQVSEAFPAPRAELHLRLPSDARRIRFPALTAGVLWPFSAPDARPSRRRLFLYGDSTATRLGRRLNKSDATDDEVFAQYMELSTKKMPDLDRFLELETWAWRNRDRDSDIPVADYILKNFRSSQLFYESARPAAGPVRYITLKLLSATFGVGFREPASILEAAEVLFENYLGYDTFGQPIHPLVAERLKLKWFDPDASYRWFMHDWTFKEWVVRCVRLAPYVDTLF